VFGVERRRRRRKRKRRSRAIKFCNGSHFGKETLTLLFLWH
jgi:hypothetical protein